MAYGSLFSRSFSQNELKKLGCGALVICFIMAFSFRTVFKQPVHSHAETVTPIYNFSNSRSDVLEINGDIRIHGSSSTISIASSLEGEINSWTIKPYARKGDNFVMGYVRTWKINNQVAEKLPVCSQNFNIPTILFSTGGYCGNHFHDFTDMLIPLYLTSHQFNGKVLFLIADKRSSWTSKYKLVLQKLSKYDFIDINRENEVLCFVRMIVGLKAHKEFGINPLEPPHYTMGEFRQFLRSTYSLERESVIVCQRCRSRPRMLIISRRKNRFLTNEVEVANMARRLGFDVVVEETGWNVSVVAKLVNSFDVLMGVHGAGLTNMVFLPENAVVIQIIPFGAELWAKPYFQFPAKEMKLRYLEYKVSLNESSLLGKYPLDSEVYRDPGAIYKKGFIGFHSVYLNNQDVTLSCARFREILLKAFELIQY